MVAGSDVFLVSLPLFLLFVCLLLENPIVVAKVLKIVVNIVGLDVILVLCYSRPNKISMATDMIEGITRGGG